MSRELIGRHSFVSGSRTGQPSVMARWIARRDVRGLDGAELVRGCRELTRVDLSAEHGDAGADAGLADVGHRAPRRSAGRPRVA